MARPCSPRDPHMALWLFLLFSLLTSVIPATPAIAATEGVKWAPVNIPTEGKLGNWVLAAGSDVQHLTRAIDGTLYAYARGLTYTLLKSTTGGYSWAYLASVSDNIVAIATSPRDANLIYYATRSRVYRSGDAGRTFISLPASPGGAGSGNMEITALSVTWATNNVIAVGTRDTDSAQFGGVYTLNEEQILSGWVDTGLSGYDAYAIAFSPNFAGDRQIIAAVTDETDTYVTTKNGFAAWGITIGNARLNKDNSAPPAPIVLTSAVISFPNDYNPATGNSDLFVAIDTGTGNGDVYKVSGPSALDLNIGAGYGLTNIDVTGLAVGGGGASARLLAGAASSAQTYLSSDGGTNWSRSLKPPTGASKAYVLMSPAPDNRLYAATTGTESALSVSRDDGVTWSQVGLIDTAVSTILDVAPSPAYDQDRTLFMVTFGGKHSLWRSTDDASTWERVFSSALADVDSFSRVELSPQYGSSSRVVFLAGVSNGLPAVWQSVDSGQKFNCRPAFDPVSGAPLNIDAWAVAGDTSLFIASYDGTNGLVYHSTNSGFFYATGTPAGSQRLNSSALSPDYDKDSTVVVGNTNGWVYWSADNGTSFEPLPPSATSAPLTGALSVAFDARFARNKTVYAASSTASKGIYRFIIGKSTAWESIDGTLPPGGMLNRLLLTNEGLLYAADSKAGAGMERSLDPTYSLGPTFETVTRGLGSNATLIGLRQSGHTLWSIDTTNVKLMTFLDTLTLPATLNSPADGATGVGSLNNHTIRNVILDWGALKEATSYQWQLNYITDFSTIPAGFDGVTSASSVRLPTLDPGTTYYWRVRASAPVYSPWSEKFSFTTSLDTEVTPLLLESPRSGAVGVPAKPLFQWGAIAGADAYEILVAGDASFSKPLVTRTGGDALPTTTWQSDLALKPNTTYYWKVRAVNASTASAWSAPSAFTVAPPPAATPPVTMSPAPTVTPPPSMPTPSPAALPQPVPTVTVTAPPVNPPLTAPPAPLTLQLPDIANWVVYLLAALLVIIILMLAIILVLVVRGRY
ncbi:MAG: hypothetical protein HY668_00290 [Chloroflexi bacterium]|nr:hypothetical protein [Chloroflexota bacterium]